MTIEQQEPAVTDTRPRCPVDIDLVDPETFEDGVPFEEFAAMREKAPVFWHPQPGTWGDGFWVVTRHADVVEVSRLPEVFSSYERGALLSVGGQDEEQSLAMTRLLMLNMDPPEHSSLRNIVQRAFTPPCDSITRASDANSSSPERVSRHAPSCQRKWKPPLRAATQISRFGVWRLTITRLPSSQLTVRMPLSRSTSSASSPSRDDSMRASTASTAPWNSDSVIIRG